MKREELVCFHESGAIGKTGQRRGRCAELWEVIDNRQVGAAFGPRHGEGGGERKALFYGTRKVYSMLLSGKGYFWTGERSYPDKKGIETSQGR